MTWLHGIDVHHGRPDSLIPWDDLDFLIHKATEGWGFKDSKCVERVSRCRELGKPCGLYHFYRPDVKASEQIENFRVMAERAKLQPGDLLPVLDFESPPNGVLKPADSEPGEQWCEEMTNAFGGAIVYINQRDWAHLGKPAWVLAYPLWVAHYPGRELAGPATPDHRPWRIWQYNGTAAYRRGDWAINRPASTKAIDMNWALDPLPVIAEPGQVVAEPEVAHQHPTFLTDVDWDELNEARKRAVLEDP